MPSFSPSLPDQNRALLTRLFSDAGYAQGRVPYLCPADAFIELAGENMRQRLLFTSTDMGEELCLRPEFTIPALQAYVKAAGAQARADQFFIGTVFRAREGEASEFHMAGIESYGRDDIAAADADVLGLSIEACEALNALSSDPAPLMIKFGDAGLLEALFTALELPAPLSRKLQKMVLRGEKLGTRFSKEANDLTKPSAHSGVLKTLRHANPEEARAFVKDILSIAGISAVGGRTAQEIAERFLDHAESEGTLLSAEQADLIDRFVAFSGEPDALSHHLRLLANEAGLNLDEALDLFDTRTGFFAARDIDLEAIEASAGFNRGPGYYSGMMFEILPQKGGKARAAGGRYDHLGQRLGAKLPVQAVGAAFWLERFSKLEGVV